MKKIIKKLKYYVVLFIVNKILKGTRFFLQKRLLLNYIGINIGENTKVVAPININEVNKISIGKDCWIGKNFTIDGNGEVIIKDMCDIAPNVTINTGGHEIGNEVRRAGKGLKFNSAIYSGVWIGANVLIINGASVRKSSVVAAGSVVTTDIEENTVAAGVPAKIKRRL